jgi:PST family polysaccharide transporter/lipopolysaccharide exporter
VVDYGKWVTGSSILSYLHEQGDDAFVGWLLASAALGWYQLGYRLSNAPATEISAVISNVMFPAFSKLQNKPAALREAFFKSVRLATFLAFPMGFGVIAVAPTFVNAILGDDWTPMIPAMQVLSVLGILGAVSTQASRLFGAIGRPDYSTKVSALRVAATAILIYPATVAAGITGTALVVVGTNLVLVVPIYLYVVVNELETTLRRFAVELSYPLAGSAVMLAVVVGTESVLPLPDSGLKLVVLIGSGVVTYVAVSLLATGLGWQIRDDLEHVYRNVAN